MLAVEESSWSAAGFSYSSEKTSKAAAGATGSMIICGTNTAALNDVFIVESNTVTS